jgi:hypothetical protein
MPAESDSDNTVHQALTLELEILRSLCSVQVSAPSRDIILRSLAHHAWHDPEHRVVFEALRRIRSSTPSAVRDELPATVTRMGFPDVDLNRYFAGRETPGLAEIEMLVRALVSQTAPGPSRP